MSEDRVTRTAAATHGTPLGWRYFDETLATAVPVTSLEHAATVAAALTRVAGPEADDLLFLDLRPRAVLLRVVGVRTGQLGPAGLALVSTLSAEVAGLGLTTTPRVDPGAVPGSGAPSVHRIDLAIDALDIPAIVPFWEAVLGYVRSPVCDVDLVDPFGSGPLVWFQQMDEPRPQRNRIHLDVLVGEDEAESRVAAALAAGGRLVSDAEAPAFWVLADVEGNEACVCTWQGRSD